MTSYSCGEARKNARICARVASTRAAAFPRRHVLRMRVAEHRAGQQVPVPGQLGLGVQGPAGVVEIDLAGRVQPGVVPGPHAVQHGGAGISRVAALEVGQRRGHRRRAGEHHRSGPVIKGRQHDRWGQILGMGRHPDRWGQVLCRDHGAPLPWSTGHLVACRRARRLLLRPSPRRQPGCRADGSAASAGSGTGHGHLARMSRPGGSGGHEVFAAEHLPQQELREHARLQRELAAVRGQGLDLAHDLSGYVAADHAPACPHGHGRRGRVRPCAGQAGSGAAAGELGRRCRGQDQAGEAAGGNHVGAAAPVPGDAGLAEELPHPDSAELLTAAAAALLPHLRFT